MFENTVLAMIPSLERGTSSANATRTAFLAEPRKNPLDASNFINN